jgi:hypothetical protein
LRWHEYGGGLPGSVLWAWYGRRFVPESSTVLAAEGRALLSNALLAISALPAGATAAKAIKACQSATGHSARAAQEIVETLAFAGILEAPPHVGMLSRFVSSRERDARPNMRVEFDAPLGFWRGHHGVNWAHAQQLFGVAKANAPVSPRTHPSPKVSPSGGRGRGLTARHRSPVPRRPAASGDVWAVTVRQDAWVALFVWDVATTRGQTYALVEYLDWFGTEPTWSSPPVQIRSDAHRARRPMWLHGLHRLTGALLLAETQPPPHEAMPTARWHGGAKDAAQLAVWCFPELG